MPEVIHDLNLRNVAGRVCYQLAQGQVLFENPRTHKIEGVFNNRNPLVAEALRDLVQPIAGSVKLSKDNWLLPSFNEITLSEVDRQLEWLRLPFENLWVDCSKGMSLFFMSTQGVEITYQSDNECKIVAFLFLFIHDHSRALKKVIGDRWFSKLCYVGSIWTKVDETHAHSGISGLDYGPLKFRTFRFVADGEDKHQIVKNGIHHVFFEVCFALNMLSNVSLVPVPPANKVPKHEHKYPRLEYHVLKIQSNRNGTISPKLEEQLRQSPRQHLRRGHLRRLTAPKYTKPYTWIPPCIVGDAERGSIVKDYLL